MKIADSVPLAPRPVNAHPCIAGGAECDPLLQD
jgi:hypothetical protein